MSIKAQTVIRPAATKARMQVVKPTHRVPAAIDAAYAVRQKAALKAIMGSLGYKGTEVGDEGSKDADASASQASNDTVWRQYSYAS